MGQMCTAAMLASGEAVNICRPSVASGINGNGDGMGATGGAAANTMTTPAPMGGAAEMNDSGMGAAGGQPAQQTDPNPGNLPGDGMNGGNGNNGGNNNGGNNNGGGNVDPNAPASVQACSAWLACVDMCPEAQGPNDAVAQQCYQQCTNGNPQGSQVYSAWVTCARNNMCVNQITNMIDQDCLFDSCLMEVEACFGKIARPMGMGSCSDFIGCLNDCPQGDQNCRDNCTESTSPESFDKYEAVITCLQDNNCFSEPDGGLNQQCFEDNCDNLWTECIVDGRTFGDGTCGDIHGCFFACDLQDGACQEGCLERGTRDAWFLFQEYLGCAGDAMCNSQMTCDDACPAERTACYAAGGGNVNPPMGGEAAPAGGAAAPAGGAAAPAGGQPAAGGAGN